jgi:hypothetical protein
MMPETPAEKYRREAEACRLKAGEATNSVAKQAWLQLAADWTKLARSTDLNQEWQAMQAPPPSKQYHWFAVIRARRVRALLTTKQIRDDREAGDHQHADDGAAADAVHLFPSFLPDLGVKTRFTIIGQDMTAFPKRLFS